MAIEKMSYKSKYLREIGKRSAQSKVYRKYQLIGLEIAKALEDEGHISLYIKLAKQRDGEELLRKAKEIALRKNIQNRGAYFMAVIRDLDKKVKKKNETR